MMAPRADKKMVHFACSFQDSFGFDYASHLSFFVSFLLKVDFP